MTSNDSYTRDELQKARGLPERGELCHQCGVRVPQFAELGEALYQRLVHLIDRQLRILVISNAI